MTSRIAKLIPDDHKVTFSRAAGAEDVQLPSPALLHAHYSLAEILHVSGMGATIDKHLRDLKDVDCLREDGSTDVASLVTTAMWGTHS